MLKELLRCNGEVTGRQFPTPIDKGTVTVQATIVGSGQVSGRVIVWGTNDSIGYVPIAAMDIEGNATLGIEAPSDAVSFLSNWEFMTASFSTPSGTIQQVICTVSGE